MSTTPAPNAAALDFDAWLNRDPLTIRDPMTMIAVSQLKHGQVLIQRAQVMSKAQTEFSDTLADINEFTIKLNRVIAVLDRDDPSVSHPVYQNLTEVQYNAILGRLLRAGAVNSSFSLSLLQRENPDGTFNMYVTKGGATQLNQNMQRFTNTISSRQQQLGLDLQTAVSQIAAANDMAAGAIKTAGRNSEIVTTSMGG